MSKTNCKSVHRGVTLIELLVVVAILSVLTAIMIPRLRVINKDRNIREAARVVAGMMSQVSNRAVDEGVAGLIIERNSNIIDPFSGNNYAGMQMYVMRKIPPFSGDDLGSVATVTGSNATIVTITILKPIEDTPTNPLVQVHDQVRLNHSSVLYRVETVSSIGTTLTITLSRGLNANYGAILPAPTTGAVVPYVVYRRPKKLESSELELPDGYYVDLRYSGPISSGDTATLFDIGGLGNVEIYFNSQGGIDRYVTYDGSGSSTITIAKGPCHLFITNFDPDDSSALPLFNSASLWVTAEQTTGSVNVAYNAIASPSATLFNQIQYARGFSATRRSANQ